MLRKKLKAGLLSNRRVPSLKARANTASYIRIRFFVYLTFLIHLLVPTLLCYYSAWRPTAKETSVIAPAILVILFFVGRWDLVSYYLRLFVLIAWLLLTYYSVGWWPCLLLACCFIAARLVFRRRSNEMEIELRFPLRGGVFYVAHGGTPGLLNAHWKSRAQKFAIDLTALNYAGTRAWGLCPSSLHTFQIYRAAVLSPCSGTVIATVNDEPDEAPFHMDARSLAGNHVIISWNDTDIFISLAHLLRNTVAVCSGDRVKPGDLLGYVGNSGHSSEPHLHIHAKKGGNPNSAIDGKGVPMRFEGRWLVRNDIVLRR